MKNFWIGWYHNENYGRWGLYSPWWISGYDSMKNDTICAAIKAENKKAAYEKIYNTYDKRPDEITFRFCEKKPDDFVPFCERFSKMDWMIWE